MQNIISNISKLKMNTICHKIATTDFICKYNNNKLYDCFYAMIASHIVKSDKMHMFTYGLVCDDVIYKKMELLLSINENKYTKSVVLSYCSNARGTIYADVYNLSDSIQVLKSKKTKSYFLCINDDYYYIISEKLLNEINYSVDGYKYFEHILSKYETANDSILFHGAALVKKQKGILIVGPKRSGKTTLWLDLMDKFDFASLSVDKTFLKVNNSHISMYGFPTRIRALAGTLLKYGDTFKQLIPYEYCNAPAEILWKGESAGKVDIPYDYIKRQYLSADINVDIKLKAIVIPEISMNNTQSINIASKTAINDIVIPQIFSPYNPEEDWWSKVGKDRVQKIQCNKDKLIEKLNNIPIYHISGSENLDDSLSRFTNIIEQL